MADTDKSFCWDFYQNHPLPTLGLTIALTVVVIYFLVYMGWLNIGGSSTDADSYSGPPTRKKTPKKTPAKRSASQEDADVEELIKIINE